MKKQLLLSLSLILGLGAMAQNESDILLLSRTLPTGTARSISLGNAMGAIGGDMTALSINPAGIAVYRSSEFSFSTGMQFNSTETEYAGLKTIDNKINFTFNQIGFVSTYKPIREAKKGAISTHFAFGYNRINNFNQNVWLEGRGVSSSILDMWVINAQGYSPEQLNSGTNPNYFGANLAYGTYLIDETNVGSKEYFNAFEDYNLDTNNIIWRADQGVSQRQLIEKSGNGGEYSLTTGMNISNVFLWGASINFQNVRSENSSVYRETNMGLTSARPTDLNYFDYFETLNRYGTAINFKLGAIIKPVNAVRLGFAFQSPTYYQLRQEYQTKVSAYYLDNYSETVSSSLSDYEYKVTTPMKLTASLGIIIGDKGFVSADYEYQDYSTSKFKSSEHGMTFDDIFWSLNQDVKTYFDKSHSIRIGGEYRVADNLLLRAGYGQYGSPYKTEYLSEAMKFNTYSGGIGYRQQNFFADFAYMLVSQNEDYYPYNWDVNNAGLSYYKENGRLPQLAKIKSLTGNAMLTFGWKF